jgi:hypothetical protein
MSEHLGKSWDEMSHEERAVFSNQFNQAHSSIDASLKHRASQPAIQDYIEWAPQFLSGADPPIHYLAKEILPESVIALWHGEPRTRKSWAGLDIGLAVATGTPPFGLERFETIVPQRVLYSSQEDSRHLVRLRAKALLRGRGIDHFPENLGFSVHAGINLESAEWHARLVEDVLEQGIRLIIFDPIRRFAMNVDKGPAEVRQITAYLRRLCNETGATVLVVHHDVKPMANNHDTRRRGHRASGGDWFAAAECPIAFESAGETCTLAYPESFKISTDPEPWTMRLETDDPRNPTIARFVGETSSAIDAADIAAQEKIVAYLGEHKGASGSRIAKDIRIKKETALTALTNLEKLGKVDCVKADKKGKPTTWFLTGSRANGNHSEPLSQATGSHRFPLTGGEPVREPLGWPNGVNDEM